MNKHQSAVGWAGFIEHNIRRIFRSRQALKSKPCGFGSCCTLLQRLNPYVLGANFGVMFRQKRYDHPLARRLYQRTNPNNGGTFTSSNRTSTGSMYS
jgi:hypothetical protein